MSGEGTADEAFVSPVDPTTLEPLGRIPVTGPRELDEAAVRAAATLAGGWSTDARLRARVLSDWAQALTANAGELTAALVAETGKPVTEARLEVRAAAEALTYNAGLAGHIGGGAGTLPDGSVAHLVREPVGVTAFIVPWNWPVLLLLRDLAPALAAGVTALVKPAPQTTQVTGRVLDLGREAGLPAGAARLIVGAAGAGRRTVAHPLVRAVAFTGSTAVGAQIMRAASEGMKRPLLELGGKGAVVICADADVTAAVDAAVAGAVVTAGQMCMACTRVLVHRRHYGAVLERLTTGLEELRIGDPADERTRIGPLISPAAGERLEARIASDPEATIVTGGRARPPGLKGFFLAPTVITGVDAASPLVQEELFGPVVTVEPFDDEPGAARLANATPFGLAMSVWTRDVDRAWRLSRALQAGTVWVNGYNRSYPAMPSGGFKSSGLGRTRGVAGVEQFTELKHIHFSVAGVPEEEPT